MKKSQEQWVIEQLKLNGYISRNLCLQERITRLGAICCNLKKEGWDFEAKYVKENGGKNYYYYVLKTPLKKIVYTIPGMGDVEGLLKKITIYK